MISEKVEWEASVLVAVSRSRIEFLLGRRDNALPIERDQGLLAFDARVRRGADAAYAGAMFRVGAWSDKEPVHGPVTAGTQGEAIVWVIVAAHVERDEVRGFDQREAIVQPHAQSAFGTRVIVDFENGLAEGAASSLLKFFVQLERARRLGSSEQGLNLRPLVGEIPGHRGHPGAGFAMGGSASGPRARSRTCRTAGFTCP